MNEWVWTIPLVFWLVMLLLPWQPWRNRETLTVANPATHADLSDISVIIPARNEAGQICRTLEALARQGENLHVIVVDDQSQDDTASRARSFQHLELNVIDGQALPKGWTGKLWALQQGVAAVERPITVLLDADITLAPGVLVELRDKMQHQKLALVSVMAELSMRTYWEKLLLPAFIYYFKQLYPFALSNNPRIKFVAAAAGGCIMMKSDTLKAIGGFAGIKATLIDDCALARRVKQKGYSTWLGLSRDVYSHRPYGDLGPIWEMVSRTAFHQLKYSLSLLLIVTAIFLTIYALPWLGLFSNSTLGQTSSTISLAIMMVMYFPILRYYRLSPLWCLAVPLVALMYLAMTWSSAIAHWTGSGKGWRGRRYNNSGDAEVQTLTG
jgi:hopene-associated glycosyltransferase HpnB